MSKPLASARRMPSITLWAPDDYCAEAEAWSTGWGDLVYGARRLPVPALVQLGVLAHADWQRLDELRRCGPVSRARLVWGPTMIGVIDQLLEVAGDCNGLRLLQRDELLPLERQLLDAGAIAISRRQLVELLNPAIMVGPQA